MKPIFYDSYPRFEKRIIRKWKKNGIRYNLGNVNALKYAWNTKVLFANLKGVKRSKKNTKDVLQQSLKI